MLTIAIIIITLNLIIIISFINDFMKFSKQSTKRSGPEFYSHKYEIFGIYAIASLFDTNSNKTTQQIPRKVAVWMVH